MVRRIVTGNSPIRCTGNQGKSLNQHGTGKALRGMRSVPSMSSTLAVGVAVTHYTLRLANVLSHSHGSAAASAHLAPGEDWDFGAN
jgi:hypothetical protein